MSDFQPPPLLLPRREVELDAASSLDAFRRRRKCLQRPPRPDCSRPVVAAEPGDVAEAESTRASTASSAMSHSFQAGLAAFYNNQKLKFYFSSSNFIPVTGLFFFLFFFFPFKICKMLGGSIAQHSNDESICYISNATGKRNKSVDRFDSVTEIILYYLISASRFSARSSASCAHPTRFEQIKPTRKI